MLLLFLLISIVQAKEITLSWVDAVKECDSQIRWGYFRQPFEDIKKLGGRYNIWETKDLYGEFKSKIECEANAKKYKKGWAEPCEMFFIGKKTIFANVTAAKFSDFRENDDFVLFKEKETCENAIKSGGNFKTEARDVYVGGADKPEPALGYRRTYNFSGPCEEKKIKACGPDGENQDWDNLN